MRKRPRPLLCLLGVVLGAACALRLGVPSLAACFAGGASQRLGARGGPGTARRAHEHGRPVADLCTEFFRGAVGSIEDVQVLAEASVAPDGKVTLGTAHGTLGGIPVYERPRPGAALHWGAPEPEPHGAEAQGTLDLDVLSDSQAALDGVQLITHPDALRQLLRWAVRDPAFEGPDWQNQYRDADDGRDTDLVAEWVELPGGRGRCLALTCATDSTREEKEEEKGALPHGGHGSVLQHRGNLLRTLLEITGFRPWVFHSAPRHDRPEEAAGFRADFGRVATGGGASGIAHRRLLSYSLGGVKVLLEADADAVTPDGRAVKLEVMRRDRYESDFGSERIVDLYFQMLFGSADVLALGLVDFERPANPWY